MMVELVSDGVEGEEGRPQAELGRGGHAKRAGGFP